MSLPDFPSRRRVLIVHNPDPAEAFDFCRGVASHRPSRGTWGFRSIPASPSSDIETLSHIATMACDGVIMMPGRSKLLRPVHARGVKIVDVDGDETSPPYPCVRLDNHHIGRLAGQYFLSRGYTHLAYIGPGTPWSHDRLRGLEEATRAAGRKLHRHISPDWNTTFTDRWISQQLRSLPRPLAVFASDDFLAARVIEVALASGWAVPADLAVVGVNDRITECIRVQPPLSSISIERFRAGQEAAEVLDDLFVGRLHGNTIRWIRPDRIIERESTASYAYDDPQITQAITIINSESCNGLSVDDVAQRIGLSRSTLERRFRQIVGRSPGTEIRRVRLDAVKHALEHTRTPLAGIAARCGFSGISSLSHCFRLATGISPNAYRQKHRSP